MPSSYIGLSLILLSLVQDMAIASPIHGSMVQDRPTASPINGSKWDYIKERTRNLTKHATKFYNAKQAKDGFQPDIPRIRCEHHCGPKDLSSDETTCLQYIHHVLSSYQYLLGVINTSGIMNSEKGDIDCIKQAISDILNWLESEGYRCENKDHHEFELADNNSSLVMRKFGTPLTSATIVIARVFAAGHPANHVKKHVAL